MRRLSSLLLAAALAGPAFAQDAHNFVPAPFDGDIRDPLTFFRPGALHQGDFSVGAMFDYAHRPLVEVIDSELGGTTRLPLLDHVLAANLSLSVAPHERILLAVAAPFYGFTVDENADFRPPTFGDVRFTAMGLILRPEHITNGGGFGLGVSGHVDFPTGNASRYVGRGGFAGGGAVLATYEFPWITLSGTVGTQFDPASTRLDNFVGQSLHTALDIGFSASQASAFHLEARRYTPFKASAKPGTGAPMEALASFRYRSSGGLFLAVGGGIGLSEGIGSARYRGFLGMGWGNMPDRRPPDADAIATFEASDQCPRDAEVFNGWQDTDGCPDELGTVTVQVLRAGRPVNGASVSIEGEAIESSVFTSNAEGTVFEDVMPDRMVRAAATMGACLSGKASLQVLEGDNPLVIVLDPQWPAQVEVRVWTPDGKPLPGATVFWRVEDRSCAPVAAVAVDEEGRTAMQMGVGPASLLVTSPGYIDHENDYRFAEGDNRVLNVTLQPEKKKVTRVRLEKARIVILEKVLFEFGKAIIDPASFPLLNDVADTIVTNPAVGRVEVSGHTDSRGSAAFNLTLSQQRADAVTAYLVGRGVDPERLISKGYGLEKPIDTNETDEGRERNRRVEFNLIDQSEAPQFEEIEVELDEQGNPILPPDAVPAGENP